jgi:hypothetical protein
MFPPKGLILLEHFPLCDGTHVSINVHVARIQQQFVTTVAAAARVRLDRRRILNGVPSTIAVAADPERPAHCNVTTPYGLVSDPVQEASVS